MIRTVLRLIGICAVLLWSATALAQTGTPTTYTLRIFVAGASTATTITIVVSAFTCSQPRVTGINVNPTTWRINDPVNAGQDCVYDDTIRLAALADGMYEGTIAASNADGTSAEHARVPFERRRPNPPAVPTGLRLSQ